MKIPEWRQRLVAPTNRYEPHDAAPIVQLDDGFFESVWWKQPWVLPWPLQALDWPTTVESLARTLPPSQVYRVDPDGTRHPGHEGDAASQILVVQDVHPLLGPIAELQRSFVQFFHCPVTTELILDATGAGSTERHDAHHLFSFQLVGEATWHLGPPAVAFPTRRFLHPVSIGPKNIAVPLHPGQVIYLPPGVRHQARPNGPMSVTLSLAVHTPTVQDALECLLDEAAILEPALRGPLASRREARGLGWVLDRERLAQQLRDLANRLGGWDPTLPEGTPLRFDPDPPVTGEWPTKEGWFQRRPHGEVDLATAHAGAEALLYLPEVRSVYVRGSLLDNDPHAHDLDLVVVCARPLDIEVIRKTLRDVDITVPWDARPVDLESVRSWQAPPWVILCLAVEAVRLGGEPVWDTPPPLRPGPRLAQALRQETALGWKAAEEQPPSETRTTWFQKRSLRLLGMLGMERRRAFTRHPEGCVELADRLAPDSAALASHVRDDLYVRDLSDEALERALDLGRSLLATQRPLPTP